jgi:hypothetical protein
VHEPLVEPEVQIGRPGVAQQCAGRLGQEVREHEPPHALERARRGAAAATDRRREVRRLGGEIAKKAVVDVRLAARDERAELRYVDDVDIALPQDRDLDATARPLGHRHQV